MLPFCGYNMADYFEHWLDDRRAADGAKLPRIFYVNWFRKDDDGKFLWPGFGENSRVLEWVFRRCDGEAEAVETPIGLVPGRRATSTPTASTSTPEALRGAADRRRRARSRPSCRRSRSTSRKFGDGLPAEMTEQLEALKQRLG